MTRPLGCHRQPNGLVGWGSAIEPGNAAGEGGVVDVGSWIGVRRRDARRGASRRWGAAERTDADAAESDRQSQRGRTAEHRELLVSSHRALLSSQELLPMTRMYTYATVSKR